MRQGLPGAAGLFHWPQFNIHKCLECGIDGNNAHTIKQKENMTPAACDTFHYTLLVVSGPVEAPLRVKWDHQAMDAFISVNTG